MSRSARIKHQLAVYGGVLSVVLIALGVLSLAGAGYVYLTPTVEEIPPEETDVQEFETGVQTSAVVTGESSLYEEGETLRNKPVYFMNTTPAVTITVTTDVPDDRPVNVSHRLILHQRGVVDDETFWERQRGLIGGEPEATGVVEDGELRTSTTIDVRQLADETAEVQEEIGVVGSVSTELRLRTRYETESVDGQPYEGELTASTELEFTDTAYWLEDELAASQTERQLGEPEIREHPPNLRLVGGLGLGGVLFLLAGVGARIWKPYDNDIRELELELDRAQYREWISEGEMPTNPKKQYVYIDSLTDLVDVAIDTNKRVIHDPELETYSVVDGDLVYYHAIDPTIIESWLNLSD